MSSTPLPEGPSSTSQSPENDISSALASLSLSTELDSALLSHLNLLDKYMFHVECLSQLFRMAFFELVQANRDKSAQGGVRLGETGYDQRMQALRRVDIEPENAQETFMLRNFSKTGGDESPGEEGLGDPLRWFGILVPQSSRDAQRRFINVLEESIEVANVLVKLRSSEKGIMELKNRSGRNEGTNDGDGMKEETLKVEDVVDISTPKDDEEDHESMTEQAATDAEISNETSMDKVNGANGDEGKEEQSLDTTA